MKFFEAIFIVLACLIIIAPEPAISSAKTDSDILNSVEKSLKDCDTSVSRLQVLLQNVPLKHKTTIASTATEKQTSPITTSQRASTMPSTSTAKSTSSSITTTPTSTSTGPFSTSSKGISTMTTTSTTESANNFSTSSIATTTITTTPAAESSSTFSASSNAISTMMTNPTTESEYTFSISSNAISTMMTNPTTESENTFSISSNAISTVITNPTTESASPSTSSNAISTVITNPTTESASPSTSSKATPTMTTEIATTSAPRTTIATAAPKKSFIVDLSKYANEKHVNILSLWGETVEKVLNNINKTVDNITKDPINEDNAIALDQQTNYLNHLVEIGELSINQTTYPVFADSTQVYELSLEANHTGTYIQDTEVTIQEMIDDSDRDRRITISLISVACILIVVVVILLICMCVRPYQEEQSKSIIRRNVHIEEAAPVAENVPETVNTGYMSFEQRFGQLSIPRISPERPSGSSNVPARSTNPFTATDRSRSNL